MKKYSTRYLEAFLLYKINIVIKQILKSNKLILSCAANFTQILDITNAFNFFMNELIIYVKGNNNENWMQYSLKAISSNELIKKNVLGLLNYFGT